MSTDELIEQYFKDHAETSNYINSQLRMVQQAVKDAARCLEHGDNDYAVANLAIARHLIAAVTDIFTLYPSHIWSELITIFHSVDDELIKLTKKN